MIIDKCWNCKEAWRTVDCDIIVQNADNNRCKPCTKYYKHRIRNEKQLEITPIVYDMNTVIGDEVQKIMCSDMLDKIKLEAMKEIQQIVINFGKKMICKVVEIKDKKDSTM